MIARDSDGRPCLREARASPLGGVPSGPLSLPGGRGAGLRRTLRQERPALAHRQERPALARRQDRRARACRQDRPARACRQDRAHRAEASDRNERPRRADRADRQGRADRADRQDRADRADGEDRALRRDRKQRALRPQRPSRRRRALGSSFCPLGPHPADYPVPRGRPGDPRLPGAGDSSDVAAPDPGPADDDRIPIQTTTRCRARCAVAPPIGSMDSFQSWHVAPPSVSATCCSPCLD